MDRFVPSLLAVLCLIICIQCSTARRRGPYQETTTCGFQRADLAPELSITGGRLAQPGEWPWQVALMYENSFLCGGQLIVEDWVLTASHCITHLNNPTGHSIMMGSIHLNNFTDGAYTQVKVVSEIFPHPNYSTLISDYDLVLLHLVEPFELTDYVTTVCLAKEGMEEIYEPGTAMWVSGWGAKEDMGSLPKTLHEVEIPMVDHEQCRVMYIGEDVISTNMICAAPVEGGKGPCGGDSGGPLVLKIDEQWWLAGTVLGGNGCGSPDFPNVFQNVIAFQEWIEPIFSNRLPESQTTRCRDDQFSCKEGWCIDYWRRCNEREDCMLSTDELYCEAELKLFDVHFHRRLSYKSIIRNFTVDNSVECAKVCVRTRKPMKCGAFDTVIGLNGTRNCSLGVEAYSIQDVTREEAEETGVSHFTYRFYPEVGDEEIRYHIGMLISPSTTRNSDQVKFVWNLNLDAPNSNTIIFTVMSVKSWTEDCSKLGKRGMLIVKPGGKKRKKNRGIGEELSSINVCLSELTKGDQLRFHSLKAKVVFYTTHLRKYALTLEYEPEYNCTKTITSPGTLKSPKYPSKYPPSLECKWHYKALPGNVINVQMRDFMVEKVPDCEFDYVQIYDGNTTEAPQLTDRRCGFTWTDIITSTSNQILIVFVSDSEVTKKGFNAIVTYERSSGSRRRTQRLTAGDTNGSVKDSGFVFYSLWGTAAFAFVVITILGIVCYMLKKRLNAANALVSNFKRNNIVFDSH